jgi:hypothetical protein
MNIKRLLNTLVGRLVISAILGLGLATIFYKTCNDKSCIVFNGPIISDFDEKVFKHGEKCYKYSMNSDSCDPKKRSVELSDPNEMK